jgi:hypothetical protein
MEMQLPWPIGRKKEKTKASREEQESWEGDWILVYDSLLREKTDDEKKKNFSRK